MPKIGDLPGAVRVLKEVQSRLVDGRFDQRHRDERPVHIESNRWITLRRSAKRINEACEKQDLESLVSCVREMKNRLRRPSIRKDLARLEGKEKPQKENDEKSEGECTCSKCGKTIDGSVGPCIEGALCTACGLEKKKVDPEDEKSVDKNKTSSDTDDSDNEQTEERSLRRRSYTR